MLHSRAYLTNANGEIVVVELVAVEVEELQEQHSEVCLVAGEPGVVPGVELEEGDDHQTEGVGAEAPSKHCGEATNKQELFQHHH